VWSTSSPGRARRARRWSIIPASPRSHLPDQRTSDASSARAPRDGKKLSLELGGKSPFLVLEDADLDAAVEGLVDAIWFNQGQVCCAGSRLLVEESVAERFLGKIKARLANFRLGDPPTSASTWAPWSIRSNAPASINWLPSRVRRRSSLACARQLSADRLLIIRRR